jgi:type III restriction enzyme
MADHVLNQLNARMSLRKPQTRSLEILADIASEIELSKAADLAGQLAAVKDAYPSVIEFERDFPSLCFALATGVGKTRLMGAFIGYLYLEKGIKHFFVLAPNSTIYEKLIDDFTPGKPKYVFKGVAEFANNAPVVVTGDNYDQGKGLRRQGDLYEADVIINIFNVDKINKDKGKIKRLNEYIGESYFDYLSKLDDLVLLMDEAHRYRAKAGMKAIAELRPILGLELTATPKSVGAKSDEFKNIVYSYDLAAAMADGYVKEPAVATRKDFDPSGLSDTDLEQVKLDDGVFYHEHTKVQLELYARNSGQSLVHPFMLVVARDTTHAAELRARIEDENFFGGRYKGKVLEVHSNLTGAESDEAAARLVALEKDGSTEIVIHVNKLKEGWDVTNLYTIVPLRASATDILTEQTLGRGLRLPYGRRTGNADVDRLTVIAHERFDELIQKAKEPGSLVQQVITIGEGGTVQRREETVVEAKPVFEQVLFGGDAGFGEREQAPFIFDKPEDRQAVEVTLNVVEEMTRKLPDGLAALNQAEVQAAIQERVTKILAPQQMVMEGVVERPDIGKIVAAVTKAVVDYSIELPVITVLPDNRQTTFGFRDFDLEGLERIAVRPMSDEIMIQELRTEIRQFLTRNLLAKREVRLEDYLVRHLIEHDEIDYDDHSDLLYKLCGQMVAHLKSYLKDDGEVESVLLSLGKQLLVPFIFEQMRAHYWETPTTYRAVVTQGFTRLKPNHYGADKGAPVQDFHNAVVPLTDTRRHLFGGFTRCCYPLQKFQSDEERRFAVLIDSKNEPSVEHWIKPAPRQFDVYYAKGNSYQPDFVVETDVEMLICEIKAKNEMDDPVVKAKARATAMWVAEANKIAEEMHKKPWRYLLIPHDAVISSATLAGLKAKYGYLASA